MAKPPLRVVPTTAPRTRHQPPALTTQAVPPARRVRCAVHYKHQRVPVPVRAAGYGTAQGNCSRQVAQATFSQLPPWPPVPPRFASMSPSQTLKFTPAESSV